MTVARLDKAAWRRQLRAARREAARTGASQADLADSPGLRHILPDAGQSVAGFHSTPLEPPTARLLGLLAGLGLTVLVPAPGPDGRQLAWSKIAPATCALPLRTARPVGPVGPARAVGAGQEL
ncbi:MAG: hypothetical protein LBD90_02075, partial [Bifidobacteriaceae bacterium]|nr:hypothetical protein [Bifidobacteriaceae bacterium]